MEYLYRKSRDQWETKEAQGRRLNVRQIYGHAGGAWDIVGFTDQHQNGGRVIFVIAMIMRGE